MRATSARVTTPSAVENYLCAIEGLALRYNVAIDYYVNNGWLVPFLSMTSFDTELGKWVKTGPLDMAVTANRVMAVSTIVIIKPYFAGVSDWVTTSGHNPVREWVLSSYLYDVLVGHCCGWHDVSDAVLCHGGSVIKI